MSTSVYIYIYMFIYIYSCLQNIYLLYIYGEYRYIPYICGEYILANCLAVHKYGIAFFYQTAAELSYTGPGGTRAGTRTRWDPGEHV